MNPNLVHLQPYPFERLAALKAGITPPRELSHIALSIGEPRHPAPQLAVKALVDNLAGLSQYPPTKGSGELRSAMATWAERRFGLAFGALDPEGQILPVTGTREALFALAQCLVDPRTTARVLMPNPFYQIYEGAALLAGAEPYFLNCREENGFMPDFESVPETVWRDCQLLYLCSPGNPTGAVLPLTTLKDLIGLADRHDFVLAADECYSEIYFDEDCPPPGLLQACAELGREDFQRCVVFHSLSKRSNLPGLRSGFVAGDRAILEDFLLYRTYHGCAMSNTVQAASLAAWNDEAHVQDNRRLYRQKFQAVLEVLTPVLEVSLPEAGFFLWPRTPLPGTDFARRLYARQNVTVLPGAYLARDTKGGNPGHDRVRIALVADLEECLEAARRIREFVLSL